MRLSGAVNNGTQSANSTMSTVGKNLTDTGGSSLSRRSCQKDNRTFSQVPTVLSMGAWLAPNELE